MIVSIAGLAEVMKISRSAAIGQQQPVSDMIQ